MSKFFKYILILFLVLFSFVGIIVAALYLFQIANKKYGKELRVLKGELLHGGRVAKGFVERLQAEKVQDVGRDMESIAKNLVKQESPKVDQKAEKVQKESRKTAVTKKSSGINDRQKQILNLIKNDAKVSMKDISSHFNTTTRTLRRDLTNLEEGGYISHVGSTKNSYYIVKNI